MTKSALRKQAGVEGKVKKSSPQQPSKKRKVKDVIPDESDDMEYDDYEHDASGIDDYAHGVVDERDAEFFINKIAIGASFPYTLNMAEILEIAGESNLNFACVPLFHPRLRRDIFGISEKRTSPKTRSEFALDYNDWASFVIGYLSAWIDLDSQAEKVRINAEAALIEEYSYANHLGLQFVFMPMPSWNCMNFARCLAQLCKTFPPTAPQLLVRIPWSFATAHGTESIDGWGLWDRIRHYIDHQPKVHVCLELPADLSSVHLEGEKLQRWAGEPLKAISIHTSVFSISKSGNKIILSKHNKQILSWFFQFEVHIILQGNPVEDFSMQDYVDCLEKLNVKGIDNEGPYPPTLYEQFTHPYRDSLRGPLDPLHDNLDSDTYRIMEQDPVKYEKYEEALESAMKDIHERNVKDGFINQKVKVAVVGPGRGPLIAASLRASKRSGVHIDLFAVEKNPNAVNTLRNRFLNQAVTIIQGDMRSILKKDDSLIKPFTLDIIVSELLGSWGDNEASPECLDCVQDALKPDGVMIPQRYCSYLAPLSSSKLWTSARDMVLPSDPRSGLDCPYVVCFHACHVIGKSKPVFEVIIMNFFFNSITTYLIPSFIYFYSLIIQIPIVHMVSTLV